VTPRNNVVVQRIRPRILDAERVRQDVLLRNVLLLADDDQAVRLAQFKQVHSIESRTALRSSHPVGNMTEKQQISLSVVALDDVDYGVTQQNHHHLFEAGIRLVVGYGDAWVR
jgi:hypothetical protein